MSYLVELDFEGDFLRARIPSNGKTYRVRFESAHNAAARLHNALSDHYHRNLYDDICAALSEMGHD